MNDRHRSDQEKKGDEDRNYGGREAEAASSERHSQFDESGEGMSLHNDVGLSSSTPQRQDHRRTSSGGGDDFAVGSQRRLSGDEAKEGRRTVLNDDVEMPSVSLGAPQRPLAIVANFKTMAGYGTAQSTSGSLDPPSPDNE